MATTNLSLDDFLRPLSIDIPKIHKLARSLCDTYTSLAKESQDQFLPTPISESLLRPAGDAEGRYLAIDIGGTNLRVGFIELLGPPAHKKLSTNGFGAAPSSHPSRVRRCLEKSWPIGDQLKREKANDLFSWIGKCIAEVVQDGCLEWPEELPEELPLGVTFSFPMIQYTLSDATLMSMGKGFAITSSLDLRKQLLMGYENARKSPSLPRIKITAIANDTVATLVAFAYQFRSNPTQKAAMGLIVGTGCNATIPLALSKLRPDKRPVKLEVLDGTNPNQDLKMAVNTEWTIKGAAGPLHDLNLITKWDKTLDAQGDAPGFQPFEYMTSGRYLGELGRLIIVDYFTNYLSIPFYSLPPKIQEKHGLTTSFLGNLGPHLSVSERDIVKQLESQLPSSNTWKWTPEAASMVYQIAKAIQIRAAGMTAAAVIGLLACAEEIKFSSPPPASNKLTNGHVARVEELMVGYTGGCIVHFQDYLDDCQRFLDEIMAEEFSDRVRPRIVLKPCHDGGIIGAGILAGTVLRLGKEIKEPGIPIGR